MSPRVCGIGMHKTGTTSLAVALYTLGSYVAGHRITDLDFDRLYELPRDEGRQYLWDSMVASIDRFDAVQDSPWWFYFRELDELLPDAKFILTTRDREKWVGSMQKHFGAKSNEWDRWFFPGKNSVDHPEAYLEVFDRHTADVTAHFADRPESFLWRNIDESLTWDPICAFLGVPVPNYPFPRSNPSHERDASVIGRAARVIRRHAQDRFGDGGIETRSYRLYTLGDEAAKLVEASAPGRDHAVRVLADEVLPHVEAVKNTMGQPFDPDGPGVEGDDSAAVLARLIFEVRHTVGLVTPFNVDSDVEGGGTVDTRCQEFLATMRAWSAAGG